jgi:predicted RNase H-like HicB family nuclease
MTEQYRYRMTVYWSQQDRTWLVEVPELPGAMADRFRSRKTFRQVYEQA